MTGYGRGESATNGFKSIVELNSVNRKQTDITINLPRELAELEPRIRDIINGRISRGRLSVVVAHHGRVGVSPKLALDADLARTYYKAMLDLHKTLGAKGEININTVLRAPGVLRQPEEEIVVSEVWPGIEKALNSALDELIKMRECEGKHLAKDIIQRLKLVRQSLRKIKQLHPPVLKKYRTALLERIQRAEIDIAANDEVDGCNTSFLAFLFVFSRGMRKMHA